MLSRLNAAPLLCPLELTEKEVTLDIQLHRVREIFHRLQLFYSNIACGGGENGGDPVDNGGTGVLNSSRFLHVKGNIRFTFDLPIAHVTVIWAIHLANTLRFNNRSLES